MQKTEILTPDKKSKIRNQKTAMRIAKKTLKLRAMGLSNSAYDMHTKKRYSIQYYDYDLEGEKHIPRENLLAIMEIFPYDCLMYETKHGIQFIGFSILHGLNITKSRALGVSKGFQNQDYWNEAKDLTLRVSAKWRVRKFHSNFRKTISEKPKFKGLCKLPNDYTISKNHLEFYKNYMELPQWVYDLYNTCTKKDYKIKIYHYKTRD